MDPFPGLNEHPQQEVFDASKTSPSGAAGALKSGIDAR
jgi:hypothetical protein